jgi:hypothetical protein
MSTQYWIGVVSRSHVLRGVAGGFAQLCHGKAAPLKRMKAGDWLIYYSPRTDMADGEPLQKFTALGCVVDDKVYPYKMAEDFIPYRRAIAYSRCHEAPIHPLITRLSFIKDPKRWGYPFRAGHIRINESDFRLIAQAMGGSIDEKKPGS